MSEGELRNVIYDEKQSVSDHSCTDKQHSTTEDRKDILHASSELRNVCPQAMYFALTSAVPFGNVSSAPKSSNAWRCESRGDPSAAIPMCVKYMTDMIRTCAAIAASKGSSNETNASGSAATPSCDALRGLGVALASYVRPSAVSACCKAAGTSLHRLAATRMRKRRTRPRSVTCLCPCFVE